MAFDPGLAQRIRDVLDGVRRAGVTERRMFGGVAFLVDGRMFVGIRDATLMARVGSERHGDALSLPHVRPMDFTGRPMKGYVVVDPPGLADDETLGHWVIWCLQHAAGLPASPKRSKA